MLRSTSCLAAIASSLILVFDSRADDEPPTVNVNGVVTLLDLVIDADEDTARKCIETLRRHLQTGAVSEREVESLRDRLADRMRAIVDDADHPLRFDALLLSAAWKDSDSLAALRTEFASPDADAGRRLDALDALVAAGDDRLLDAVENSLADTDHNSIEFRGRVLTALARFDHADVSRVVLARFDALEPEVRSCALELLTQRPAWTRPLLGAIAAETIEKGVLNVNQLRRIATFEDEELREQFHAIYGAIREGRDPQREQLVNRMRDFLNETPGDPHQGVEAFKKVCGQCHRIYGEGSEVGPDITRNGRNDWNQLLSNVFDPSLVIGPGYQARQLVTEDGRVLTGLPVEESELRVVLKVQGGKLETIPRDQIDVYQVSELSMMPEQLENQLTPREIADLMAFLALDKHPDDPEARYLPGAPRFEGAQSLRAADRGFLVIAPDRFHPELSGYVAHKQQQLPMSLVSLETALSKSPGVDDAERLKRYLFDAWERDRIGYVLLVGDADVLPVRYMTLDRITPAAFDYAFYPSDLYYSDLAKPDGSFESWNAQQDGFHSGYFGEVRGEKNKEDPINFDEVDYLPDVAVGRWPVSTAEQVRTVADKTMAFESGLLSEDKPGMRRAGLFGVGGWVDSRPALDDVAGSLPESWSIERRYFTDRRRNDETPAPNWEALNELLNDGLGFVFHAGHGSDDSWHDCFPLSRLEELDNADRLPIMVSAGCSTARLATLPPYEAYLDVDGAEHQGTDHGEVFESPPPPPACYQPAPYNTTGLGEQLLRGGPDGAVAYIGCNTGSQPCGLTLLRGIAIELGEAGDKRLGDCWSGAITFYHREERLAELTPSEHWYPPSVFFQGMKFMLFGDPTLLLPDSSSME